MPYQAATFDAVQRRIRADLNARIPELINASPHSLAAAIVNTIAGGVQQMDASIPAIIEATHPATATGEHLTTLAATWKINRKENESDAALRARYHDRLNRAPAAMTAHDWKRVAEAQPAVAHAWVIDEYPPDVEIYVVAADGSNLTAEQLATAKAGMEAERPAGCPLAIASPARTNITCRLNAPQPVPPVLQDAITRLAILDSGMQAHFNPQVFYTAAQIVGEPINIHSPTEQVAMERRSIPQFNFPAPPF